MNINLNETPQKVEIPIEHKRLEAGLFGKLFGTGVNASNNIAGIILIGLLLVMMVSWFIDPDKSLKFIGIAAPIMTLTLGYLFGKQA
jgi:hypothetical protein